MTIARAVLMLDACMLVWCGLAHAGESRKTMIAPATAEHPRNGEGDLLPLRDRRLMLVYSRFDAGATADDSPAQICRRYSSDNGTTWTGDEVLIRRGADMNLMSVSLLRLHSGEIMLAYGRRRSNADLRFYARFSKDDGQTWGADVPITPDKAYHVINNARIIQAQVRPARRAGCVVPWRNVEKRLLLFRHHLDQRRRRPQLAIRASTAHRPGLLLRRR
jgi:hypothetical protein